MRTLMSRSRYLVIAASVTSLVFAFVTFVWSIAAGFELVKHLVTDNGWKAPSAISELLGVLDLIFIGTTLVVLAIGLWELFVSDLDEPAWLNITSLDDLKKKVADLIILVVAVKLFEKMLVVKNPQDVMYLGLGVALVGGTLIAFTSIRRNDH